MGLGFPGNLYGFLYVYKSQIRRKLLTYSGFGFAIGGERGIRTPGTSQYVGFQDRCNRPLCHLSKRRELSCDFPFPVVRPQGLEPWTH